MPPARKALAKRASVRSVSSRGSTAAKVARGQSAQFCVDERQQLSERAVVAVRQSYEQSRYFVARGSGQGELPLIKTVRESGAASLKILRGQYKRPTVLYQLSRP